MRIHKFVTGLCVITLLSEEMVLSKSDQKTKRQINSLPLVFPYGATYKLLIGFSSPVPNDENISLFFSSNFQYQYLHFQNISELSQYYFINTVSREQREADLNSRREERLTFYSALEQMLDSKGFAGRACLLRAICEAAQYPFEDQGLVADIVQILLTPFYGKNPFQETDIEWRDMMSEYISAQRAGQQMFLCPYIYSDCPEGLGLLEFISRLQND